MVDLALSLGTLELGDPEGDPGGIGWKTDSCWHSVIELTAIDPRRYKPGKTSSHQLGGVHRS